MNKIILTVALVFLVVHCVVCGPKHKHEKKESSDSKENSNEAMQKAITNFFRKTDVTIISDVIDMVEKTKEKCPDFEYKFNDTFEEVGECVTNLEIGSSTVCATVMVAISKCSKPVRDLINNCLPMESKGLPLVVEKFLIGVLKQTCSSTLEELLEIFNPCHYQKDVSEFPSCLEIKNLAKTYRHKLPSKKFACSLLPKVQTCSNDVHAFSCTNPITLNIFNKFHKSVEHETEEVCRNHDKNELA